MSGVTQRVQEKSEGCGFRKEKDKLRQNLYISLFLNVK